MKFDFDAGGSYDSGGTTGSAGGTGSYRRPLGGGFTFNVEGSVKTDFSGDGGWSGKAGVKGWGCEAGAKASGYFSGDVRVIPTVGLTF